MQRNPQKCFNVGDTKKTLEETLLLSRHKAQALLCLLPRREITPKEYRGSATPARFCGFQAASLVTSRISRVEDVLAKVSWKSGQPVPYGAFCDMLHTVEETSSR